jgi:hypothetical protein
VPRKKKKAKKGEVWMYIFSYGLHPFMCGVSFAPWCELAPWCEASLCWPEYYW